jgi:dTDP-glucose 4,6-dehydratase
MVQSICDLVDNRAPPVSGIALRRSLIAFKPDRPGHDLRYAMDSGKARKVLNWAPTHDLDAGLAQTVDWYLANEGWWRPLIAKGATDRRGLNRAGD